MTCAACVRRVEQGLRKLPNVVGASVNLATERASVQFDRVPVEEDAQAVNELIRKLGYEPIDLQNDIGASSSERHLIERKRLWQNVIVSATLTLPLLIVAMGPMLSDSVMSAMMTLGTMETWNWIMFALAAPVQFWFGGQFLRQGAKSLLALAPDMNALVLIGTVFGVCLQYRGHDCP